MMDGPSTPDPAAGRSDPHGAGSVAERLGWSRDWRQPVPPRHADAAFNTLATHDLVPGILRGSIMDTDDVAAWLTRNPPSPPRDYTSTGRPIY